MKHLQTLHSGNVTLSVYEFPDETFTVFVKCGAMSIEFRRDDFGSLVALINELTREGE